MDPSTPLTPSLSSLLLPQHNTKQQSFIHSLFCEISTQSENTLIHSLLSLLDNPLRWCFISLPTPGLHQDDLHSRPQQNICDTRLRPIKPPNKPPTDQHTRLGSPISPLPSLVSAHSWNTNSNSKTAHFHAWSPVNARFRDPPGRRFPRTHTIFWSRRSFSEPIQPPLIPSEDHHPSHKSDPQADDLCASVVARCCLSKQTDC